MPSLAFRFDSEYGYFAWILSPTAEAGGLSPSQYRFESYRVYLGECMSAKQTKGRSTKTGRRKKGAKGGYFGNKNASKSAKARKHPRRKKKSPSQRGSKPGPKKGSKNKK